MRRRDALLVLALGVAPTSLVAQAQLTFNLSDSVLAVPVTATRSVELDLYTGCDGVGSYSITLFVDRARVHLARADSIPGYGLAAPVVDSSVADQYTLSGGAAAYAYCTQPLALLTFDVGTTTASGSLVSARVNSAVGLSPAADITPGYRTGVLNVCQADKVSGDVDRSLTVNSRDALVVLTAAVGLSVPGTFDMTVADVDGDHAVTSRDALFILSAGIGLAEPYGVTAGKGIAARCAPLAPAPADMVFLTSAGMVVVDSGTTTRLSVPLANAPSTSSSPRWAPDGSLIAYECSNSAWAPYTQTICMAQPNGTLVRHLDLVSSGRAYSPSWMPQGWRIAYINSADHSIWVANVDSSSATAVTRGYVVHDLTWAPDGRHIAFVGYDSITCCSDSLYVVSVDSLTVRLVGRATAAQTPTYPAWSPAGDSLLYYNGYYGRAYKVGAVGDTTAGTPAIALLGSQNYAAWLGAGYGFQSNGVTYPSLFFQQASGRDLRVTQGVDYTGDYRVDFRRTGIPYVNSVTVTPGSPDTLIQGNTLQLTGTVTNNDASVGTAPVTWVSRDTLKVKVDASGLVSGVDTTAAGRYVVGTVGGWRSDSVLVVVIP